MDIYLTLDITAYLFALAGIIFIIFIRLAERKNKRHQGTDKLPDHESTIDKDFNDNDN